MPRKTARNRRGRRSTVARFNEAAARCRGKPSGCSGGRRGSPGFNEAAARCRGKPPAYAPRLPRRGGFNEAAARCRGKPRARRLGVFLRVASMRPRPDAAENRSRTCAPNGPGVPASMRPRPDAAENPRGRSAAHARGSCFNEAAARCRGKPCRRHRADRTQPCASMRPRPDAAENPAARRPGPPPPPVRFNEAAARCRGKPAERWIVSNADLAPLQ